MASRAIAWVKENQGGAEFADVLIAHKRLTATGLSIGTAPVGYRLDYKLETDYGFTTLGLLVTARGTGWNRKLDLRRNRRGRWTVRTKREGNPDLPAPGGDTSLFAEALDCDLALSPLTNSMPVLRHGLLQGGGPVDFLMAWVSVPDLGVRASRQRYTFVRAEAQGAVVRYKSLDSGFTADITFDADGLVVDYPELARRA
ncbi:MAG: hypothetical protein AUG06_09460 [Actinobacteria bacterium 13_1_20CM_2_65_11]|nr:MAG: hypothetical protein AUH40_02730 [Chloroflexi bacterium 13_1_40CM_65_17]OLC67354.1 MAG: hypothetical protein AUH69_04525 [Actinobacteria bacterium 13_1_40CM_4_65_12]OLD50865.1 MAG: hypothetical protein AUI42_01390 [Actinobacteria bacterium 13_1_40CM_2_65_8]OLE78768.1 MAG: hypothetical protein AUG06_09460 [Actinobacteria bacterium 13_1_20CM_2_65_11]